MTDRHLAASGSDTSGYDTWVKAASSTTLAMTAAITASAAGDDFYMDAALTISNAATATWTFKGTVGSPNRVFSCSGITNDAPLTADLGRGATHTNTGTVAQTITGFVYIWGFNFNIATSGTVNFNLCNNLASDITIDDGQINFPGSGAGSIVVSGGTGLMARVTLINTPVKFVGTTASTINVSDCDFHWKNTANAIPTGSQAALANLFTPTTNRPCKVTCDNVDFVGQVGIASGKNLVGACPNGSYFKFSHCKVNAGVLIARPTSPACMIDLINCDSTGALAYKLWRVMYQGDLTDDETVYNNANDGTTQSSWKIVATANNKPQAPFRCFEITRKVLAGTYAASKIFLTSSDAALKTHDAWVDVYGEAWFVTSFGAGAAGTLPQIPSGSTPAAIAGASPAWGHGSAGTDYQLTIPSFTMAADGEVLFQVYIGKASLTAYVDQNPTVA